METAQNPDDMWDILDAEEVIALCNKCLAVSGLVAKVKSLEEVRLVCSSTSMFLAAVEVVQQARIPGTFRRPSSAAERATNCMKAIEALSILLKSDLSHISGERIVQGSIEDIVNVLEIIAVLSQGQLKDHPPLWSESPHGQQQQGGQAKTAGQQQQGGDDSQEYDYYEDRTSDASEEEDYDDGERDQDAGRYDDAYEQYDYDERGAHYDEEQARPQGAGPSSRAYDQPGVPLGLFRRDEHPTSNITDTFSLSSGSGGSSSGDAWEAAAAALGRSAGARRKKKKVVSGGRAKPQAAKPQQSKKSQLQPIPGAAMSKAGKVLRTDITVSSQHPHGTAGVAAQHYAAGFAGAKYAAARELAAAAAAAAKRDAHEEAEMFAQAALEAVGDEDGVPPGQQLSAHLAAKLAHIYNLAMENPKAAAARVRVQMRVAESEEARQVQRQALVERMARAFERRDASMNQAKERNTKRSQDHATRVEQLRLARMAADFRARQKSAALRQATLVELALKDAFLAAVDAEKERLIALRKDAAAQNAAHLPNFRRVLSKAERHYQSQHRIVEDLAARERRMRMNAEKEALTARQESNAVQARAVYDRMAELLERVAQEEEAIMARNTILDGQQHQGQLMVQLRQMLGLR